MPSPPFLCQHWQSTQVHGLQRQVLRFGLFAAAAGAGAVLAFTGFDIELLLCCHLANHVITCVLWYRVKYEKRDDDCAAGQGRWRRR